MHKDAMTESKERRQRAIADLIRSQPLANQEELAEQLTSRGFAVTQATVSRDLEQLGAVKARRGGRMTYALPQQVRDGAAPQLASVFRDWVRSIDAAGNLVVIKTPPGSAHLVGVALDGADLPEVVGTICGDDTIFVACRTAAAGKNLVRDLSGHAGSLP
jgi:transcriptional regulator of arginine metabolism